MDSYLYQVWEAGSWILHILPLHPMPKTLVKVDHDQLKITEVYCDDACRFMGWMFKGVTFLHVKCKICVTFLSRKQENWWPFLHIFRKKRNHWHQPTQIPSLSAGLVSSLRSLGWAAGHWGWKKISRRPGGWGKGNLDPKRVYVGDTWNIYCGSI